MIPKTFPFTAHPKRTRTFLLLLMALVLCAGGVLMIRNGNARGWLPAVFFGLCIPVVLVQFHPRGSFLTIDADGVEYGTLFRVRRIAWSEVEEFGLLVNRKYGLEVNRFVGINFSSTYPLRKRMHAASKALTGFEDALPDTYGFSADELATLLSACHAAFTETELEPEGETDADDTPRDDE